jgi:hypothetical protein
VLAIDPESEAVRSCSSPLSLSFVTICHVIIYHEELLILHQFCVLHSLLQIRNGVTQEYGMCMVVHNAPLCVVSPERSIQSHPNLAQCMLAHEDLIKQSVNVTSVLCKSLRRTFSTSFCNVLSVYRRTLNMLPLFIAVGKIRIAPRHESVSSR